MKTFRVIAAAFMVFLGAMLVVAWAIAGRAVEAIDSGEAATNITEKLLAEPQLADAVATRIQTELETRVADSPLRFLVGAFSNEIHDALVAVITSDAVTNVVTTSVGRVEERITQEVIDPNRPPGPFVVTINPAERINARIDQIPVVGFLIPSVEVEPITVEVIDEKTFEDVRTIYKILDGVATWAIWVAIVLVVAGFWVAPKSRWYWAQALLGAGFIVLAVSFAIGRLVPSSLANAVPGGPSGGAGKFLSEFVSENTIGPMTRVLFGLALGALALALLFALVAKFLPKREREVVVAEAPEVVPVAAAPIPPEASWAVAAAGAGTPAVVHDPGIVPEPVVVPELPVVDEPAVIAEPAVVAEAVSTPEPVGPVATATPRPPPRRRQPGNRHLPRRPVGLVQRPRVPPRRRRPRLSRPRLPPLRPSRRQARPLRPRSPRRRQRQRRPLPPRSRRRRKVRRPRSRPAARARRSPRSRPPRAREHAKPAAASGRCARLLRGERYLTAPAVNPPTMYRCRKRKRITTGTAAMTAPAAKALQSA